MTTQCIVADEYGRNSMKKFVVHDTEIPNAEARLATILIERWGMVTGKTEGEDSSGRAVLKEMTPDEVVDRACSTAEKALAAFRSRGWMIDGPDASELLKKTDD